MAKEVKKETTLRTLLCQLYLCLRLKTALGICMLPYHSDTALNQGLCGFRGIITRGLRIQRLTSGQHQPNPFPLRLVISYLMANNRLLLGKVCRRISDTVIRKGFSDLQISSYKCRTDKALGRLKEKNLHLCSLACMQLCPAALFEKKA